MDAIRKRYGRLENFITYCDENGINKSIENIYEHNINWFNKDGNDMFVYNGIADDTDLSDN